MVGEYAGRKIDTYRQAYAPVAACLLSCVISVVAFQAFYGDSISNHKKTGVFPFHYACM